MVKAPPFVVVEENEIEDKPVVPAAMLELIVNGILPPVIVTDVVFEGACVEVEILVIDDKYPATTVNDVPNTLLTTVEPPSVVLAPNVTLTVPKASVGCKVKVQV